MDDGDVNEDGEMQLVMECWVEPQHGKVTNSPSQRSYMNGLRYFRIADAVSKEVALSLLFFRSPIVNSYYKSICSDMPSGCSVYIITFDNGACATHV